MESRTRSERVEKAGREGLGLLKLSLLALLVLSSFQTFLAFETYALTHREAYHACVERTRTGSHAREVCLGFQPFFEGEGRLAESLAALRDRSARLVERLPELLGSARAHVYGWISGDPDTRET
jgi:hypothetical protein